MRGFKPDHRIWTKVNQAILDENLGAVMVTLISGLCAALVQAGVCADETHARVQLAAMLLSPDSDSAPGSLVPLLQGELNRLNDGKWIV